LNTNRFAAPGATDRRVVGSWALFDFANSVYPAVVITAVFPLYFKGHVVGGEGGEGDLWWGVALSCSALLVACSAPFLGAIADRARARKRLFKFYVAVCLLGVASMSTLDAGMVVRGVLCFVIANIGFESAIVFYNSYLPEIAPPEKQGRVSGLGFGLGYLGSALGLLMVLPLARAEVMPPIWMMVAGFFLLFSLPAFRYLPADRAVTGKSRVFGGVASATQTHADPMSIRQAAKWGRSNFRRIVADVWRMKDLRNFLIAYFFFIDGVLTIIGFAALVAEGTFGFTQVQVIILFFIVQFSALIGAFVLARPTDRAGPKKVLNGVLLLWIAAGITAYFIQSQTAFYILAIVAGFGLGAIQSASRAAMSLLIPKGKEAEMFGFYAFCGKTSSVIGPLLMGGTAYLAEGNQRPGFLVLTALFVIGLLLLRRVPVLKVG